MTRKSKITKRELAAVLRESVVAPNKPGPLKVIIDVGDPRYYMQRTLELVTLSLTSPSTEQQEYYLEQAIFLLGVAKHTIRRNQKKANLNPDKLETDVDLQESIEEIEKIRIRNEKEGLMKLAGDPY